MARSFNQKVEAYKQLEEDIKEGIQSECQAIVKSLKTKAFKSSKEIGLATGFSEGWIDSVSGGRVIPSINTYEQLYALLKAAELAEKRP